HDAQSSMALLVSPLMSYAEISLPLPASQDLWLAPNAVQWKALYFEKFTDAPVRLPSLVECLNDLELLETFKHFIDERISTMAILNGAWGLVWEYRQLSSVLKGQSRQWDSTLVMTSRYQDLTKLLQHIAIGSTEYSPLVLELTLMHLHMSLEDVQLLAGLEGPEEARRVRPVLRDWVKTVASRRAVWHAGQVIRAAKSLPSQALRDFHVIAVYHASLALWAYGLALDGNPTLSSHAVVSPAHSATQEQRLWLDGFETTDVQRFIALNRGSPSLRALENTPKTAELKNPKAVMDVVLDILSHNYDIMDGPKPPLVENLMKLMVLLRDATTGSNG
ncbi:hypothetical protein LTR60_003750, partial [Cryomyces antarcticus]